jgi:hypothetical protein
MEAVIAKNFAVLIPNGIFPWREMDAQFRQFQEPKFPATQIRVGDAKFVEKTSHSFEK